MTWTYGYDNCNQLTSAQQWDDDPDENELAVLQLDVEYKYDVWGSRIERSADADGAGEDPAVVTRFAVDGWNPAKMGGVGLEHFDVWADMDGNSSLTTRYLRGDAIDSLFARLEGSDLFWYLSDYQGSLRNVLDSTGAVVGTMAYDGFGNLTTVYDPEIHGRYTYTGREWDVETELQYNRARYYDPSTGRWITQDPLGFDAGDSNLYRYVRNSHPNWVDASGYTLVAHDEYTAKRWLEHLRTWGEGFDQIQVQQGPTGRWVFSAPRSLMINPESTFKTWSGKVTKQDRMALAGLLNLDDVLLSWSRGQGTLYDAQGSWKWEVVRTKTSVAEDQLGLAGLEQIVEGMVQVDALVRGKDGQMYVQSYEVPVAYRLGGFRTMTKYERDKERAREALFEEQRRFQDLTQIGISSATRMRQWEDWIEQGNAADETLYWAINIALIIDWTTSSYLWSRRIVVCRHSNSSWTVLVLDFRKVAVNGQAA